ncbi:MAG: 7TM domain-containing protein [Patescibacteria group bacterium]|jgi:PKD repeat protein
MFKKKLLFLLIILGCLAIFPGTVLAQEIIPTDIDSPGTDAANQLKPAITSEEYIPVGRKALFDAADSILLSTDMEPTYRWDFTDTNIVQFGKEVVHEFAITGVHKITLTIQQGEFNASLEKQVFVYNKKILMVSDLKTTKDMQLIVEQAAHSGVYLKIISAVQEDTGFLTEEKLVPLIGEETDFIREANALIFYTDASLGLQAFTRYWQNLEDDKKINLTDKLIVKITDQNIGIAEKLAHQSYEVIHPNYILLTRKEALNPIFESDDYNKLIGNLADRAIEYRVIDSRSEKSPAFILSHAITNFITKGIPTNTIYLLLAYPFIVLIITFFRQVVGIAAFGIYTPSVIALSLIILGLYFGLATILIVVAVSYILRIILNRFKLIYMAKTGLILASIGLSFLALMWILSYYQVSLAISLAIFPMLVMSTVSEKFLSAQSEEGLRGALLGVVKTIFVSLVAYYLVVWTTFNNLLLSWPELILVPLVGLIILGRFTGLRLNEYFRFRSLFKEKNIEEE